MLQVLRQSACNGRERADSVRCCALSAPLLSARLVLVAGIHITWHSGHHESVSGSQWVHNECYNLLMRRLRRFVSQSRVTGEQLVPQTLRQQQPAGSSRREQQDGAEGRFQGHDRHLMSAELFRVSPPCAKSFPSVKNDLFSLSNPDSSGIPRHQNHFNGHS